MFFGEGLDGGEGVGVEVGAGTALCGREARDDVWSFERVTRGPGIELGVGDWGGGDGGGVGVGTGVGWCLVVEAAAGSVSEGIG